MEQAMRRKDRLLSITDAVAVLQRGEYGVMATIGETGQPYGVPISYVYWKDKIYIHCTTTGHKLDNLVFEPRISFTVVDNVKAFLKGESNFTTTFESVIVFGQAHPIDEETKKIEILTELCRKYLPEHLDKVSLSLQRSLQVTEVYEIIPTRISGKAHRV